jgi:putative FmdB family regulatory protein
MPKTMPIYEYVCCTCRHEVERLQKLSDEPLKVCPVCGQPEMVRKVSAPSFRLKGGGWYETDFKGEKDKKRNLVDTPKSDGKSDSPASAKTEAKPASTTGSKPEVKPAAKPAETKAASTSRGKANPT